MDTTTDKYLIQVVRDIAELKTMVQNYADIELRVRELEKARWKNAFVTSIISSGLSAVIVAIAVKVVLG